MRQGLTMRLRGGVEFEDVTDEPMDDAGAVEALRAAVARLESNKMLLHTGPMTFFRDYLTSMGAKIPRAPRIPISTDTYTAPSDTPAPTPVEEEESEESEEDAMEDSDVVAEADADLDAPQPPPDVSKEPTDEDFAKAGELKGKVMEAADDAAKAAEMWSEIIALAPNANAVASRGLCYIALKKPMAGMRDADAALGINPDSAKAYKTRGRAKAALGRWVDAVKDLGTGQGIDYDDDTAAFQTSIKEKADKVTAKEARSRARGLKNKEKQQRAELARRKEEAVKRRQEEVEEENERERQTMADQRGGGGGGGGMPGGGGGIPPGMEALFSDPEIMKSMQNPKVMQVRAPPPLCSFPLPISSHICVSIYVYTYLLTLECVHIYIY